MKIKTSELIGPALDWAVAKCEYDELAAKNIQYPQYAKHYPTISPSTDWAQAGPIIEREWINVVKHENGTDWKAAAEVWMLDDGHPSVGETPLIAAMRCYVESKLGDTVEVPDEVTP